MIFSARNVATVSSGYARSLTALKALTAGLAIILVMPSQAQTLDSEVRQLLESNPRVMAAVSQLEAAEQEVGVARSDYLPTVSLRGDVGPEYIDTPSSRRLSGEEGRSDLTRRTASLAVTQRLFDGSLTSANLAAARIAERLALLNLRFTAQEVLHQASLAYLDLLRHQELVQLATENMGVIQVQAGLENERVSRGSGVAVDVLLAKTRLQLATERVVAFEGALKAAKARYAQVFGKAPRPERMTRPQFPQSWLPQTLDDALDAASNDNISLSIAAEEVGLAEEHRRAAAAARWPKLDLIGSLGYEQDIAALPGSGDQYSVLLTMTWDIYSGSRVRSDIAAKTAEREQARFTAEYVHRQVTEEVTRAFEALSTAERRVEMLGNASTIAEEVFDARVKLREAGSETAINVLDARSETFRARINLTEAGFDSDAALLRLMLATGRLEPEFLGAEAPASLANILQ